jgi:hypothetical protein
MLRTVAAVAAALGLACPTTLAASEKDAEFALPPYSGAYEPQNVDERGLWLEIDELERKVGHFKDVVRSPELGAYLQEVLCRSVGEDRCRGARIYVLRDASFNAGMYPNGMMVVHSGLLLRMHNEAELASVLGHEFAHFEKRHVLNGFRKARTAGDILSWAAVLGVNPGIQSLFLADLFRFSRDQEREADLVSAEYLRASPYPSRAAAAVWVRAIDEDAAQAKERKRSKRNAATGWLDSHPSNHARATYLARFSEAAADDGDERGDRFAAAMRPHLLSFFDDQLQRNDFAATLYVLEEMASDGWSPDLLLLKGELYRKRGNPRDLVTAMEAFESAVAAGCDRPEAWRGLGLVQLRAGRMDEGREALATYLRLRPDAPDAPMMTAMIGG